ncbi:HNH endonuclease [Saccharothrix hoggarensis]|uniref:HNH endonuclease n=1 Tax=Saccharothrix hoggarensis TaxID=913853 RepID=A0ABW3QU96_9PSEU
MRAWSLLSVGEYRHFQGNTGYADVLGSTYVFDSTVTYADKVREGHVVVLRNREVALGVARVEGIEVQDGLEKMRLVCPACKRTKFKKRAVASPAFLCQKCRTKFDTPEAVQVPITRYTAHYGSTWRELPGVTVERLRAIALNQSKQQSISPLDPNRVVDLLAELAVPLPPSSTPPSPSSELPAGHRVELVRVRTGQQAFRAALLQRDGEVCAITGPCPKEALEAAHLRQFAVHVDHSTDAGILLRADVHSLFDRGMMAVNPSSKQVCLAPALRVYPMYAQLEGRPTSLAGVDLDAVRQHFTAAAATWR